MRKVLFISLGCDKNLADSEEMLGILVENGYENLGMMSHSIEMF